MDLKDMRSPEINEIATALAKAQGAMSNAMTNKENPHFRSKYASLDSVINAAKDAMAANGLSVVQPVMPTNPGAMLVTMIMHTSGQWLASHYPLTMAGTPQQQGAAMTYMRRYNLMSMLGIAPSEAPEDYDDDDGNEATRAHNGRRPPQPAPQQSAPAEIEPPIDPETGEVRPHKIAATKFSELGQKLIAALDVAADELEVDEWMHLHAEQLAMMEEKQPNMFKIVQQHAGSRRMFLRQP